MKKFYALSLLMTAGFSFGQISDSFTGTGTLIANGWTTHSGNNPGQLSIIPGSLEYTGLVSAGNKTQIINGNTEDVNLALPTQITTTGYYAALINFPNTTSLLANSAIGDYPLMFASLTTTGTPSLTIFTGRIYFKQGATANTVNIGILNLSGGTVAPTYSTVDYPINTTHFIVVKYELSANRASLWINPTIGGTETTPTVTNSTGTSTVPASLERFAIRQGSSTGNMLIDEIRIGTTWAQVTAASLSVKDNAIVGLKVYPNPVTGGKFFISTDANNEKAVVIYDVLGKQVLNTTATESVNVSNLKGGVYIVKITEEGKTATRKLVIK